MKHETRVKQTGEIFTPPELVDEIINKLPSDLFTDSTKTFIDPAMGDGEFLRGVIRKLKTTQPDFHTLDAIDNQLYGVELMWDNTCDALYFLLTEHNPTLRVTPVVLQDGFTSEPADDATPDEINILFTEIRKYAFGSTNELWIRKSDNHHMEFRFKSDPGWERIEHLVRANALTDWDFDNWKPKNES